MKNADMPAMPVRGCDGEPMVLRGEDPIMYSGEAMGLSKREMMAMHCCAALLAGEQFSHAGVVQVAELSVEQADALLAALEGN